MACTIKGPLPCIGRENDTSTTVLGIWKLGNRKQVLRKRNSEKKDTKMGILEEKKRKKIEIESSRHAPISWFPLSLSKSYSLPETKGSPVHQPFKSVSLKVINFYGRITLGDYSLWEEAFFPLWLWSCRSDLIWFLFLF